MAARRPKQATASSDRMSGSTYSWFSITRPRFLVVVIVVAIVVQVSVLPWHLMTSSIPILSQITKPIDLDFLQRRTFILDLFVAVLLIVIFTLLAIRVLTSVRRLDITATSFDRSNWIELIYGCDPLARSVQQTYQKENWLIYLTSVVFYTSLTIPFGIVASAMYVSHSLDIVTIWDIHEWPIFLTIQCILIPTTWCYYVWQPRAIVEVMSKVADNGVITHISGNDKSLDNLVTTAINRFHERVNSRIVLAVAVIAGIVSSASTLDSNNPSLFDHETIWWQTSSAYYWFVLFPLILSIIYMLIWMFARQLFAVVLFWRVFEEFTLTPKLYHRDNCNGFAPFGNYAFRVGYLLVIYGLAVSLLVVFPVFYGERVNIKVDTIILMIVYVAALVGLVVPSLWPVHTKLSKSKTKQLTEIAKEIEEYSSVRDAIKINETIHDTRRVEYLDLWIKLSNIYELIERHHVVWPFRTRNLERFALAAVSPLIATLVRYIIYIFNPLLSAAP